MSARILVVEDDALEARRLLSALAAIGHDCVHVEDGDAALARLCAEPFDCVLLDLVLPGLDGMGVLRALQARGIAVPVVVAATHAGIDAVESALKAGARDFVVKPAGALRLKVALANAIGHRPARAAEADNLIVFPMARPPEPEEEEAHVIPLLDASGHARPLAHLEREAIAAAIALYGGRMSEVARRLGMGRSTLYRRLGELGLAAPVLAEPSPGLFVAAE